MSQHLWPEFRDLRVCVCMYERLRDNKLKVKNHVDSTARIYCTMVLNLLFHIKTNPPLVLFIIVFELFF